jgi:superfamily II DNA helicase RecQ
MFPDSLMNDGICLVMPLVALMKDQVANLAEHQSHCLNWRYPI